MNSFRRAPAKGEDRAARVQTCCLCADGRPLGSGALSPQFPLPPSPAPPHTHPPPASATMSEHFSLSDCDVIGFDLDHTLCRYHLKETSRVSAREARSDTQPHAWRPGRFDAQHIWIQNSTGGASIRAHGHLSIRARIVETFGRRCGRRRCAGGGGDAMRGSRCCSRAA